MKRIRNWSFVIILVLMASLLFPARALADSSLADSGDEGTIHWEIWLVEEPSGAYDRVLRLSGYGRTGDYSYKGMCDSCQDGERPAWFDSEYSPRLRGIEIGQGITYLGQWAFSPRTNQYNYINEVVIPDSVTEIAANCFANQKDLRRVVIPDSVTAIGEDAFESCVTIVCSSTSAAYQYAKSHNLYVELTDLTISVSPERLEIRQGESARITAVSSNPSIPVTFRVSTSMYETAKVSVTDDGLVTGLAGGDATVYIHAASASAQCEVHVLKKTDVVYELDGGTNAASNPSSFYEDETIALADPTREGYVFDGWYTRRNYTLNGYEYYNKIDALSSSVGSGTVYAAWKKAESEAVVTPDPVPAKVTGLKLVNKKTKKLKVTFTAVTGAEGYEIQYTKKASFKNAKTVIVTKASAVLKKLTKNKTWHVRVRAYVTGADGSKVYGPWSAAKKKKVTK